VGTGHPSPHGPGRHQPAASHAVCRAQRRRRQPLGAGAGAVAASSRDTRRPLTRVGPSRVVAVVGTGTDIGKTWVAARLLTGLRAAGLGVAARDEAKAVSGHHGEPGPRLGATGTVAFDRSLENVDVGFEANGAAMAAAGMSFQSHGGVFSLIVFVNVALRRARARRRGRRAGTPYLKVFWSPS